METMLEVKERMKKKISDFVSDLNKVSMDSRALPNKKPIGKFSFEYKEAENTIEAVVYYFNLEINDNKTIVYTQTTEITGEEVEMRKVQFLQIFYAQFFRSCFLKEDEGNNLSIITLIKKGL